MKEELITHIQSLFSTTGQIPLHAPFISNEEIEAVQQEVGTGLFSTSSPTIHQFETDLANYISAPYVVATNSGTAALHTALAVSGVGKNDIVLTQAFSFVATANAITYCGASPVFLDIDKSSLSMSIESLTQFLETECLLREGICIHQKTQKRVAVCLLVHAFGHVAELEAIIQLLKKYAIDFIEDAAQAVGSRFQSQHSGTFGRFGCFSFNGNKLITTGGGGAVVCQTKDDYEKVLRFVNQGKEGKGFNYYHATIGHNYKMTGISAAMGKVQLNKIEAILARKRTITDSYHTFFQARGIEMIPNPIHSDSNFWLNNILVETKEDKESLIACLNKNHIEARPAWWPIHQLPMYEKSFIANCKNTLEIYGRLVSLPSGSLFKN